MKVNPRIKRWTQSHFKAYVRLQTVNEKRLPLFRQHLEQGGKCYLELGCGSGEFSAKLSKKTGNWVLGIDLHEVPMHNFKRFTLGAYERAEKFLYLRNTYAGLLMGWDQFNWLSESALKTFMIFPDTIRSFEEEVQLWLRCSVPGGELHVRTEKPEVAEGIKGVIPFAWEEIPFAQEASSISSSATLVTLKDHTSLYVFGIKRLTTRP